MHHDLPIESTGTEERRVEHIGPVCGGQDDDALVPGKAIHLSEDLVERLLAFIMTTERSRSPAGASNRVDLVDEDDGRRHFARFREQFTHPSGTDTDDHLYEFGRTGAEERHLGLACRCAGEQRLTGARSTGQEHAFRRAGSESLIFSRVAKKVDDLVDLGLDLIDPRHTVERDANSFRVDAPLLAPTEHSTHGRLLTPEHERVKRDNQ